MKRIHLTLIALFCAMASFAQVAPIVGISHICAGSITAESDATPGGIWSSGAPGVAIVGSSSGLVTGVASGTATITYTVGTSFATLSITVDPIPAPIAGPSSFCVGSSITLTDGSIGGVWSSSTPTVAAVGSISGTLTGISAGTTVISYSLPTGCITTSLISVNPMPTAISGSPVVCTGTTITLASAPSGGTWVSTPSFVASVTTSTGIVTGLSLGTATITYTLGTGCYSTTTVTVSSGSVPLHNVTGGGSYCSGGSGMHIGLDGSNTGVNYQLLLGGVPVGALVAGTGGALDFGAFTSSGTYTVAATGGTGCSATMTGSATISIAALPVAYTITGGGSYCAGGTGVAIGLSGSDPGVNYQLYAGTAPVGTPVAGTGSYISFGPVTGGSTYTVIATNGSGCITTMSGTATITVYPIPTAFVVSGGGSYCAGGTGVHVYLANSVTGINYQAMIGGTLIGGPIAGTGAAIDFGLFTPPGTYTIVARDPVTSCTNNMVGSATITVTPVVTPTATIIATPGTTICAGAQDTFTVASTGGGTTPGYQWSVNGAPVAGATNSTFSYMPLTGDVVTIDLTSTAPCASPTLVAASVTITVSSPTIIASVAPSGCGGSVTLSATGGASYSWLPATGLSCSTCSSPTLIPLTSTTYTVTGTDGFGCSGTATVSTDGNRISGHINYAGGVSTDTFKVWLIQFNPSDSSITALDSVDNCNDGGTPYFEFMDKPAGNYLVKAKLNSSIPGTSGYIPTYSLSSPHWDSAATVAHTSSADTLHIDMVYGTVPVGPGFISGYVVSGAGKSTAGEVPVDGMTIYLKNTAGTIITYTTTAPDGTYSFSNLGYGTYLIYPETYKYYTLPSTLITLAPGADTVSAINFKKHTTTGLITPYDNTKVHPAPIVAKGISLYPNPAQDKVTIVGTGIEDGNTKISLYDQLGKLVYTTNTSVTNGLLMVPVELKSLPVAVYTINITTASGNITRLQLVKD